MRQFFWAHKTNEKKDRQEYILSFTFSFVLPWPIRPLLRTASNFETQIHIIRFTVFWHEIHQFEIVSESNLNLKKNEIQHHNLTIPICSFMNFMNDS